MRKKGEKIAFKQKLNKSSVGLEGIFSTNQQHVRLSAGDYIDALLSHVFYRTLHQICFVIEHWLLRKLLFFIGIAEFSGQDVPHLEAQQ